MNWLGTLSLILIAVIICGQLSTCLKLPAVLGELLCGVILGPAVLHWLQPSHLLDTLADLGVICLMFLAGLDSDLPALKKLWRPCLLVAVMGMIIPIITADLTGHYFYLSNTASLFLGVTFAATSVSISVVVLQEMQQLKSLAGTTILGAAVIDDLLAVLVLSLVTSLEQQKKAATGQPLWQTLLIQLIFLLILVLICPKIVAWLMKLSQHLVLPASETAVALSLCLFLSYLAKLVGLSDVIGAFFAGLAISRTKTKKIVNHNMEALGYSLLIPIFFISIGLKLTVAGLKKDWLLILFLTIGGIGAKLLGAALGARLAHFSWHNAWIIGAGMIARGEMALVVAQMGLKQHLLAPDYYSAVIAAIILTTLIAPILLRFFLKQHHQ
ncbi:cation:proton antiporter [Bombilactobacillus folatiphilus]|uniref:Cation:proton antiporter n=1 Tax=Bombilactobacillus folatiphilus TaxID=2923362 RepID=A0ABY4P8A3_9LACO|nr:cation:proton antiporter [Bombilactobacillus folatiphilus]UQS81935.1 cation:proton antiporter [Bombilactobacillus folatiphilus]